MATVVVLAGCTTTTGGQATPAPEAPPGTSSPSVAPSTDVDPGTLPADGAPEVDDPLDTTKFQENPCLTLRPDQSEDVFGISPAGQRYTDTLGNACKWKNEESRAQADVRFLDKNGRGLSAEYAVNEEGRWALFEELMVQDHPAVIRGLVDRRAEGICTVVVGASDEIAYEVVLRQSDAKIGTRDPCEVAADMAGETVKTIKAG